MTLERARPALDRLLAPAVDAARRLGLTPNVVSVAGFVVAALGATAFYGGGTVDPRWFAVAGLLVALSGVLDVVDGLLARELGAASDRGDLLDHTLDRYADIVLVGGLAAAVDQLALGFLAVTGVVMTSYLGTQAQAIGFGRLYAGLLGRSDRVALIGLVGFVMAVHPDPIGGLSAIGWLLAVLAVVGHATAVQRFAVVWRSGS